ncbi:MAG: hypothetical protein IPK82_43300 [Polyangiaceae bacterium]|nr:hypothetical protein [Polyangiaceae bacterium]
MQNVPLKGSYLGGTEITEIHGFFVFWAAIGSHCVSEHLSGWITVDVYP